MPKLSEQQAKNFLTNLENHLQDRWLGKKTLQSEKNSSHRNLKQKLSAIRAGRRPLKMDFVVDVAKSLGCRASSLLAEPPARASLTKASEKIIKQAKLLDYTRESLAKTLHISADKLFSTINQGRAKLAAQEINRLSIFLSLDPAHFKPLAAADVDFSKLHCGGSISKLNQAILNQIKATTGIKKQGDKLHWLSQKSGLSTSHLSEIFKTSTRTNHKTYKNYQTIFKSLNTTLEEMTQLAKLRGTSLKALSKLRETSQAEAFKKVHSKLNLVGSYGGFYQTLEQLRSRDKIIREHWNKTFTSAERQILQNKAIPSAQIVDKVCKLFKLDINALNREIGIVHGKAMGDLIKKGAKKLIVVGATGVGASLAFANPVFAAARIEEVLDPNEGILPSSPTAISATTLAMLTPYRWYAAGAASTLSLTNYCGEVLRDGSKKYAELLKGLSTDTDFVGFDGLSEQERVEAGRIFGTGLVKVTEWLSDNLKLLTAKADKKVSEGMQALVKQAQDNANNPKEALHFSYRTLDQECKKKGEILWAKVKKGLHEVGKMVQEQGEIYAKQVEDLPTPLIHINGISEQELAQAIIGFGKLLQKNHQHEPAVNSLEKTAAGMPETELPNAQASPINKEESQSIDNILLSSVDDLIGETIEPLSATDVFDVFEASYEEEVVVAPSDPINVDEIVSPMLEKINKHSSFFQYTNPQVYTEQDINKEYQYFPLPIRQAVKTVAKQMGNDNQSPYLQSLQFDLTTAQTIFGLKDFWDQNKSNDVFSTMTQHFSKKFTVHSDYLEQVRNQQSTSNTNTADFTAENGETKLRTMFEALQNEASSPEKLSESFTSLHDALASDYHQLMLLDNLEQAKQNTGPTSNQQKQIDQMLSEYLVKQDAFNQAQLKQMGVITEYISEKMNAIQQAQREQNRRAEFQGVIAGFNMLANLGETTGNNTLTKIGQVGALSTSIVMNVASLTGTLGLAQMTGFAALGPIGAIVGAVLCLGSFLFRSRKKKDNGLQMQLHAIQQALYSLHAEMRQSFQQVYHRQDMIYYAVIDGFTAILQDFKKPTIERLEAIQAQLQRLFQYTKIRFDSSEMFQLIQLLTKSQANIEKLRLDNKAYTHFGLLQNWLNRTASPIYTGTADVTTCPPTEHYTEAKNIIAYLATQAKALDPSFPEDIKIKELMNLNLWKPTILEMRQVMDSGLLDYDTRLVQEKIHGSIQNYQQLIQYFQTSRNLTNKIQENCNKLIAVIQQLIDNKFVEAKKKQYELNTKLIEKKAGKEELDETQQMLEAMQGQECKVTELFPGTAEHDQLLKHLDELEKYYNLMHAIGLLIGMKQEHLAPLDIKNQILNHPYNPFDFQASEPAWENNSLAYKDKQYYETIRTQSITIDGKQYVLAMVAKREGLHIRRYSLDEQKWSDLDVIKLWDQYNQVCYKSIRVNVLRVGKEETLSIVFCDNKCINLALYSLKDNKLQRLTKTPKWGDGNAPGREFDKIQTAVMCIRFDNIFDPFNGDIFSEEDALLITCFCGKQGDLFLWSYRPSKDDWTLENHSLSATGQLATAPQYYSTIQTNAIPGRDGKCHLLLSVRASEGLILHTYRYEPLITHWVWSQLANGPEWSDAKGFQKAEHYKTLRTCVIEIDNEKQLVAMMSTQKGLELWSYSPKGDAWKELQTLPELAVSKKDMYRYPIGNWGQYPVGRYRRIHDRRERQQDPTLGQTYYYESLTAHVVHMHGQEKLLVMVPKEHTLNVWCYDPNENTWEPLLEETYGLLWGKAGNKNLKHEAYTFRSLCVTHNDYPQLVLSRRDATGYQCWPYKLALPQLKTQKNELSSPFSRMRSFQRKCEASLKTLRKNQPFIQSSLQVELYTLDELMQNKPKPCQIKSKTQVMKYMHASSPFSHEKVEKLAGRVANLTNKQLKTHLLNNGLTFSNDELKANEELIKDYLVKKLSKEKNRDHFNRMKDPDAQEAFFQKIACRAEKCLSAEDKQLDDNMLRWCFDAWKKCELASEAQLLKKVG